MYMPAANYAPWNIVVEDDPWASPIYTIPGKGMTFEELQKKFPLDDRPGHKWYLLRVSRRGNRVMYGQSVECCDNVVDGGGTMYSYDITAIVRPNGEVVQYTVEETGEHAY